MHCLPQNSYHACKIPWKLTLKIVKERKNFGWTRERVLPHWYNFLADVPWSWARTSLFLSRTTSQSQFQAATLYPTASYLFSSLPLGFILCWFFWPVGTYNPLTVPHFTASYPTLPPPHLAYTPSSIIISTLHVPSSPSLLSAHVSVAW